MRRQVSQTGPVIEVLGEIKVDGQCAVVTWPQLGDGVAIDFPEMKSRYGVVVALDSDPRLKVEPEHAALVEIEERLLILEQVSALWCQLAIDKATGLRWVAGR